MLLPPAGPDALVSGGLGPAFRIPEHAPFTEGFLAPTDTFDEPVTITLAGLTVELTPAESDATDSITIWFPDLGVCRQQPDVAGAVQRVRDPWRGVPRPTRSCSPASTT